MVVTWRSLGQEGFYPDKTVVSTGCVQPKGLKENKMKGGKKERWDKSLGYRRTDLCSLGGGSGFWKEKWACKREGGSGMIGKPNRRGDTIITPRAVLISPFVVNPVP